MNYFASRHPGAAEWAKRHGMHDVSVVEHLDPQIVQRGDTVAGTLPVHLAATVCERGARYLHLAIDIPAHMRGHELTADELVRYGARLEEYSILKPGVAERPA